MQGVEQTALNQADIVLPVYKSILPYTKRLGAKNVEVVYNVLNETFLREKTDYMLHQPIRIISVGRQFKDKNPENLLRAIPMLPNVHLTLVGDGPSHAYLRGVVRECQMQDRVTFHRNLPNDELCSQLPDYDIFAVHSEYWEISKAVLEALLTGLPVVINRRVGNPVPELQGDFVMMVDNSVDGYYKALKKLIADDKYREKLGRLAYAHAQKNWAPKKMEQKIVDLYRSLLPG
jgi:glycosyltransferase involved in cell wall biosynthesis